MALHAGLAFGDRASRRQTGDCAGIKLTADETLDEFNEHLSELSETWYDGDPKVRSGTRPFKSSHQTRRSLMSNVIEMTAIDHSGDLEVEWLVRRVNRLRLCSNFQASGRRTQVIRRQGSEVLGGTRGASQCSQHLNSLSGISQSES